MIELRDGDIIHLEYPNGCTPQQRVDVENWYASLGVRVGLSTTNMSIHAYRVVSVIRQHYCATPHVIVTDTPSSL